MMKNKLIDGIIKEPLGGAHTDSKTASKELKKTILSNLANLNKLSSEKRISDRIDKFSTMGAYA